MSTVPTLHKFLVYAPDKANCSALRFQVRPRHFEGVNPLIKSGVIKVAGMMITPESLEGEDKQPIGSVLIVEAETLERARSMMESDIYYTSGVWDPEKLVIVPLVMATAL